MWGWPDGISTDVPSNTARAPGGHQHADLATRTGEQLGMFLDLLGLDIAPWQRAILAISIPKAGEGASALDRS